MDIINMRDSAKILTACALLLLIGCTDAYKTSSFPLYGCQGKDLPTRSCGGGVYDIASVTVYTSSDPIEIEKENITDCLAPAKCSRVIHSASDPALNPAYQYLFKWLHEKCQGRNTCMDNSTVPSWWALVDNTNSGCKDKGTQYVTAILVDVECKVGEDIPEVLITQPNTTPRTRPTTPTTTTMFPVALFIYQPTLEAQEKIILAVAIGLAVAILVVVLIILYCCEKYRNHRKFSKLLALLGAPQAADDGFDDFADYATTDAWKDEADCTGGAIGEYTGVKPNEFMTLDKSALESSGQIMYDPFGNNATMGRGTSCSTLGRNGVGSRGGNPAVNAAYDGPTDYDAPDNLELERRMAENLNPTTDEEVSYH